MVAILLFSYDEGNELKKLVFDEMTEQWLDFVVACRRGITHSYDIVEGPMADGQIWNLFLYFYIKALCILD